MYFDDIHIRKNFFQKCTELLFTLYIISLYLFELNKKRLIISQTIFIAFAGFALLNILYRRRIYIGKGVAVAYIFFVYVFASALWAQNRNIALSKAMTIFQVFVLFYFVYNTFYEMPDYKETVLRALFLAGAALCIYSFKIYGFQGIVDGLMQGKRLGRKISQENVFGMQLAITASISFFYWYIKGKNRLFYMSVMCVSFIIAMSSGSRKALIIFVLSVFYMIFMKYGKRQMYKSLVVFLVLFSIFISVIKMPIFKMVTERMEGVVHVLQNDSEQESSAVKRNNFIKMGWDLFKENPLIGYGADNFRIASNTGVYAHNNFIEILTDFGLIGFMLYYSLYILAYKNVNKENDDEGRFFKMFFIARLFIEIANVCYFDKLTWVYFAVWLVPCFEDNKYIREILKKQNENGEKTNQLAGTEGDLA